MVAEVEADRPRRLLNLLKRLVVREADRLRLSRRGPLVVVKVAVRPRRLHLDIRQRGHMTLKLRLRHQLANYWIYRRRLRRVVNHRRKRHGPSNRLLPKRVTRHVQEDPPKVC